jgi:hypothetical protein
MRNPLIFKLFSGSILFTVLSSYFLPFYNGAYEEIRIILTTTSILFSIVAGFSIAYLLTRFNDVRTSVAEETGILTNLYKFFETLGSRKHTELMRHYIDRYVTAVLDFPLHEHVDKVRQEYFDLFKPIQEVRKEKIQNANYVYNRTLALMHQFGNVRKKNIIFVATRLSIYHWSLLAILAFILTTILLYTRTQSMISLIMTPLLMIAIFTVLVVIKHLERLTLGSEMLWIENYERIFDVIGIPRYYAEHVTKRGYRIPQDKPYRYVTYKANKKEVKIIKPRSK